jgi:hypothetical protein
MREIQIALVGRLFAGSTNKFEAKCSAPIPTLEPARHLKILGGLFGGIHPASNWLGVLFGPQVFHHAIS